VNPWRFHLIRLPGLSVGGGSERKELFFLKPTHFKDRS
jgi:hypothetical protein